MGGYDMISSAGWCNLSKSFMSIVGFKYMHPGRAKYDESHDIVIRSQWYVAEKNINKAKAK